MKKLPLALLVAALMGAQQFRSALADEAHTMPGTGQAAGKDKKAAPRCDAAGITPAKVEEHNKAVEGLVSAGEKTPYPNLIILPNEKAQEKATLCSEDPRVWAVIRNGGEMRTAFNQAQNLENQIALIKKVQGQLTKLDERMKAINKSAAKIHALAERYANSLSTATAGLKGPKTFTTKLSAEEQQKMLQVLIKRTGRPLAGAKEPNAARPDSPVGGTDIEDFYKLVKELAKDSPVAEAVHPDWRKFLDGAVNNDPDNQIFNREQMRVVYYSNAADDPDYIPENAKLGALNKIDPETGKELRKAFYGVRADLNKANETAGRLYIRIDGETMAALAKAQAEEKKAIEEKKKALEAKKKEIAGLTANKLFDGSNATQEDKDLVATAIAQRARVEGKNIVFTVTDKDNKKRTESIPATDYKNPDSLAQNEKFQKVVELLKQDKKIAALTGAIGLAVSPPKEDKPEVKPEAPKDPAGPAPSLTVSPKASSLSPDQQNLMAAAKAAGPGCTSNTQDNYAANAQEKIADEASKRIREGKNADKDLDRAAKDLANARKDADDKSDSEYKDAMAPYDRLKEANKISPADYQAAQAKLAQARDQKKAAHLQAFNDGMDKANAAAVDAVNKAGTPKTVEKWKQGEEAKIKDDVEFLYNQGITNQAPKVRTQFGSAEGKKALDPDLAKFDPSGFIPAYLGERWGDPPAALNDAKTYIKNYNAQYPLDSQEVGPGVNKFVPKDFQKWFSAKQADMAKQAPKTPNNPESTPPATAKGKVNLSDVRKKIDDGK